MNIAEFHVFRGFLIAQSYINVRIFIINRKQFIVFPNKK